ncbi:helix-turn-helix transcriptional regulator [Curtobacterium sp. PhB78]|uniref:helix-turn-helix domain-containing protein n=1 Tax=Curtobacterium sp. PhB78 TaxID=2485102 RepID=UPI000F463464|nr:helix-turn-helix transcriptional regulator [Curtobacterium sp. PhB78]ROS37159.1 hypothetical protein EDF53_1395 [Curtobacterium sp. PhB78]
MQIDQVIPELRGTAGFGATRIAARSGVSRPTVYRMLGGASPRVDDLRELAIAAGFDLDVTLSVLSDPLAAVAARSRLGDDRLADWADPASEWVARLERFVGTAEHADAAAVIAEAGVAAGPLNRDGTVLLTADAWDIDRLVSAGRASNAPWALSGWAALDALGIGDGMVAPTIVWTEDPRAFAQLLGDTFRRGRGEAVDVAVVPAHPSVFIGATEIEAVHLVDPLQGLIDAAGLGESARSAVAQYARGGR